MKNQILKFIDRDEILQQFPEQGCSAYQHLLGFYQKSPGYVLYCSIIQDDDSSWQYYYNCNHDVAHSYFDHDNKFNTYQECYDQMMKDIEGLSCEEPKMWGFGVNEITRTMESFGY